MMGVIVISAHAVFSRLQPLINVGIKIMEFVKKFFVKIFQMPIRQNFSLSKFYAIR